MVPVVGAVAVSLKNMRTRIQGPRVVVRRVFAKRHNLEDENDPLFDERELEFCGYGDEKVKPPEE